MTRRTLYYFVPTLLTVVLLAALAIAFVARAKRAESDARPLEGLGNFGIVPDFALTDRSGARIALSELKGKIWLADFIYTACKDACPLESAAMAQLQNDLPDRLKLVSFSVDPERDTPAVLARYAEGFHADPARWLFLTGNKSDVQRLVQEGFHLSAIPITEDSAHTDGEVYHDAHFVLIDGAAQIRGYYESNDPAALKRLRADAKKLLAENG
jgi:protein SCO1